MNQPIMRNPYEQIGLKIFRYIDNKLEICRITEVSNDGTIIMEVESDNEIKKGYGKTSETIKEEGYDILAPCGYIIFSIVDCGDTMDVIVNLHKREEVLEGNNQPFVICRQYISDIFTNNLSTYTEADGEYKADNTYVGLSVNRNSCPPNIEFDKLSYCNGLVLHKMIAVYLNDHLDTVLSLINKELHLYDETLELLVEKEIDELAGDNKIIRSSLENKNIVGKGYCRTLKDLLESNNFWTDFCTAYTIYDLTLDLTEDAKAEVVTAQNTAVLSYLINKDINKTIIVKYDHSVDMDEIAKDYILVRDVFNQLYIIGYTYTGPRYSLPNTYDGGMDAFSELFETLESHHKDNLNYALSKIKNNSVKYN